MPNNITLDENVVRQLIHRRGNMRIITDYKHILLSDNKYIKEFITWHGKVIAGFSDRIPNILIQIYLGKERNIHKEEFDDADNKWKIIYEYINKFTKAPPKWMCIKQYREKIIGINTSAIDYLIDHEKEFTKGANVKFDVIFVTDDMERNFDVRITKRITLCGIPKSHIKRIIARQSMRGMSGDGRICP